MKGCNCNTQKTKQELNEVVSFLKAISEENRLRILCLLQAGELCVCEIWESLDLHQNLVSHHLRVLRDFGLIKSRKEGTKVLYTLHPENTKRHLKLLSRFL